MSRTSLGRLGLMFVSLLGLMSLFSGSAFAAGKPTSLSVSGSSYGITHFQEQGAANPNGAATTAKLEFREAGATEWQTLLTKEIGSGTTVVSTGGVMINGLKPSTYYQIRMSATNSFGTVYSFTSYVGTWWRNMASGSPPSSFGSYGTFKLEYTSFGTSVKYECNESGSGMIGYELGVGNSYHLNTSGCVLYVNGVAKCNQKSGFSFNFDPSFKDETYAHYIIPCTETEGMEVMYTLSEPLFVSMPYEVYNVTQPLTMTAKAKFGGANATVTVTSNWSLTGGETAGKKFAIQME
jgi:hypothetical protein